MAQTDSVLLGYEVGSGKEVYIPIRNMICTGQTQEAGKTTTLEALVSRSQWRAVAFITKRFERSFQNARTIPPYFREPDAAAMWRFVVSLIESALHEKQKFIRPWIMRVCRGARTLQQVHKGVKVALRDARGLSESVYTEIDEYLNIVIPQIDKLPYVKEVKLKLGLNVCELGDYTSEMQALVIRSFLEWVYEREDHTLTIIPEAWEFLPQKRSSPVLLAAESLIRKGSAGRNYLWMDAQDLANVNKDVTRSAIVWLLGVQRERNEVKRTLDHIVGRPKPSTEDVMNLGLGQFWVCFGQTMKRVYVQPAWMTAKEARAIAEGTLDARNSSSVKTHLNALRSTKGGDEQMWKERYEEERKLRLELERRVTELERQLSNPHYHEKKEEKAPPEPAKQAVEREEVKLPSVPENGDVEKMYAYFRARILREPKVIKLLSLKPSIDVHHQVQTISVNETALRGRIAKMISSGFFNTPQTANTVYHELRDHLRVSTSKPTVYRECDELAVMGFLYKTKSGYRAVEGMEVNILE